MGTPLTFIESAEALSREDPLVWVSAERLAYDSGDIAHALDPQLAANGHCQRPVHLEGQPFAVTGAMGRATEPGYLVAWAYELVPISEYEGEVYTYAQLTRRRSPSRLRLEPQRLSGIVVSCPLGECVLGERIEIVAEVKRAL